DPGVVARPERLARLRQEERLGRQTLGVACRVSPQSPIELRCHPGGDREQLEVRERRQGGPVDERGALRLETHRHPRSGESRRRPADRAEIDRVAYADESGLEALLLDARQNLPQHLRDRHAVERRPELLRERRREADDDLVRALSGIRETRLPKEYTALRARLFG